MHSTYLPCLVRIKNSTTVFSCSKLFSRSQKYSLMHGHSLVTVCVLLTEIPHSREIFFFYKYLFLLCFRLCCKFLVLKFCALSLEAMGVLKLFWFGFVRDGFFSVMVWRFQFIHILGIYSFRIDNTIV